MQWALGLVLAAALPACSKPADSAGRRAEIKQVGPASVQLLPAAGQLPFCLAFTASERGVVRQLTMPPDRLAVPCAQGEPIGGLTYRIPPEEGKVRIYVLFSDQPIKADPIGEQVYEVGSAGRPLIGMDLRAPGKVHLETLEFAPSADAAEAAIVGDAVTRDAGGGGAAPQ
jgi:hypothetical protein